MYTHVICQYGQHPVDPFVNAVLRLAEPLRV